MNPIAPVTWWQAAHASATAGPAWASASPSGSSPASRRRPAHRGRGAGEQLLHRSQRGQSGPEGAALADVVDGQIEGGLAEAGEVPDAAPPSRRRSPSASPALTDSLAEFEHAMHLEASERREPARTRARGGARTTPPSRTSTTRSDPSERTSSPAIGAPAQQTVDVVQRREPSAQLDARRGRRKRRAFGSCARLPHPSSSSARSGGSAACRSRTPATLSANATASSQLALGDTRPAPPRCARPGPGSTAAAAATTPSILNSEPSSLTRADAVVLERLHESVGPGPGRARRAVPAGAPRTRARPPRETAYPPRRRLGRDAALELRHRAPAGAARSCALAGGACGLAAHGSSTPSTARGRHALVRRLQAGEDEEPIRGGVRAVVGLELVVPAAGLRGGRAAVRLDRDEPLRLDRERRAQQRHLEAARAVAPAPEQAGEHRDRRQQSGREVGHRDPAGALGNAIGVSRFRHQQSRKCLRDEVECGQRRLRAVASQRGDAAPHRGRIDLAHALAVQLESSRRGRAGGCGARRRPSGSALGWPRDRPPSLRSITTERLLRFSA